ncbi:isocitrate/isopropylmalate dehydrogenase family protein [Candidatus Kaiserbacteria bacterium]|nr:isocitrate/isopropylmalate dehydrogenase family protein [Candidatus Kaiserbacteria bacterium]
MKKRLVTVLPGDKDGIGPEVMSATLRVLEAMDVPLMWDIVEPLGIGGALNPVAIGSLERTQLGLKGPTASEGHRSYNVQLRELFGLYANVRPIHTIPGIKTRFSDVPINLVVVRQGTEDSYIGEEYEIEGGAEAISRMTYAECRRISEFAFEFARKHGRKKVTVIHKANILPKTHGLFRDVARQVSKDYPEIECDDAKYADASLMRIVERPERFDVILAPNMFGDLASDIFAAFVGGVGVAAGWNAGQKVSVFETVGGTAPDIAGQGIANPTAMMLTAAMLLDHVGSESLAVCLRSAIFEVLKNRLAVTKDIDPVNYVSTEAFADAVIRSL